MVEIPPDGKKIVIDKIELEKPYHKRTPLPVQLFNGILPLFLDFNSLMDKDNLIKTAVARSGLDDFWKEDEDYWREGLDVSSSTL